MGGELEWIMQNDAASIVHIAGKSPVSKYDFGRRVCKGLGMDSSLIHRGTIDDINFRANRAKDQTMDSNSYQRMSGRTLPSTDETVEMIVQRYKESVSA